jgi:hypothetical protein
VKAAIVAVVLVGLAGLVGGVVWVMIGRGGGKGGRGADSDDGVVADVRREPVPEPEKRPTGPDGWKSVVDSAPPSERLTAPPDTHAGKVLMVLTGGPGSAAAGVLEVVVKHNEPVTWHRYDLRKSAKLGVVPTVMMAAPQPLRPDTLPLPPMLADLSPAGDRLAIRLPEAADAITIWDATAGRLAEWKPVAGKPIEWVRFVGNAGVLAVANGRLLRFDLATKTTAFTAGEGLSGPAALSPGGKFVAAAKPDRIEWFQTDKGQPAGTLPLPPNPIPHELRGFGPAPPSPDGLAISPDGSRFVATYRKRQYLNLFTWDLETGAPISAASAQVGRDVVSRYSECLAERDIPVAWLDSRYVLLEGCVVFDPETNRTIWEYKAPVTMRAAATSPDGRVWFLSKPSEGFSAVRLPDAQAIKRAEELTADKGGPLLFPPGSSVRVEASGGPADVRRKMAEAVADRLTAAGVRVDPEAKAVARIAITGPFETTIRQSEGMPINGRQYYRDDPATGMKVEMTYSGPNGEGTGLSDSKEVKSRDGLRPAIEKVKEEIVVWTNTLNFQGRRTTAEANAAAAAYVPPKVSDYPKDDSQAAKP